MTPFEINLLLHIYVSPDESPSANAPIYPGTIDQFINHSLITGADTDNGYTVTERGRAHVDQLCQLPWPTQAWIGADGEIIQ